MPSFAINSTVNCCSSRDPPSPDGLSPRPAKSPIKLPKRNSMKAPKDPVSSVSSVDAAELQKVTFTNEKEHISAIAAETIISKKPHAILEGDQIYLGEGAKAVKERKSISSLNLKSVTQKLKKRLSRESAVNKRHSRLSVGTSEEEVERRAELRRIRQKRIQEELSNEGIYDDDAKSLPSITDIPSGVENDSSWVPGEVLSLPTLKAPALPFPTLLLPKLQPIERQYDPFLEHPGAMNPKSRPMSDSVHNITTSSVTVSHRHSSPILSDFKLSFVDPRVYTPSRKRSSIPPIPPTPSIEAQRLPSIAEPNKSSWRLSFTSPNRGEHLRKLSQEYVVPMNLTSELLGSSRPPINRWLHSQGLRSPSQAVESTEDSLNLESFASHSQIWSTSQDFGGVDGPKDGSTTIHLHEMGISQRLASKGLQNSTSSPQLSSWGSHQRGASSMSGNPQVTRNGRARYMRNTSDSIPLSERIPKSWGNIIQDGTSSFNPSICNSIQPSLQGSRFNFMSLSAGGKSRVNLAETLDIDPTPPLQAKITVQRYVAEPGAGLTVPSTPCARRSTIDDSSMLASETESFREIEAELRVVQARFASNDAQRVPSLPKSSRFREEFDTEPQAPEAVERNPRKQSVLVRLTRFAARSYDGANGMEDLLAIPMPNFGPTSTPLRSPGAVSPLNDSSDVTAIWDKAVKLTAEERANDVGSHLQVPRKKSRLGSNGSRKKSSMGGGLRSLSLKNGGKVKANNDEHESAAAEYEKRFQERLAVKELVMDDWEAEMAATAQKAKAKSRNIVKRTKPPTGPDRRFPLSWSRYPSHSRSERSLSAGRTDQVESHDFAMRFSDTGERVFHQCREIGELHLHDDDPDWHKYNQEEMGLAARVGDKISQKVYRLETHGGGSKAFEFQTDGRRGSMVIASKLEFPELEVLPVTPVNTEELEQNISEKKLIDAKEERRVVAAKTTAYGDGGADSGSENRNIDDSAIEDLEMSIADPRFYDDCIVAQTSDDADVGEDTLGEIQSVQRNLPKKEKFGTWHGRDGYKHGRRGRNMSLGTTALRKSTDDYYSELEKMEEQERDRVLKIAETAWGVTK